MPHIQLSSLSRAVSQEPAIDLAKHEASDWTNIQLEASNRSNAHYHFHSPSATDGGRPGSFCSQRHEGSWHRLLSLSAVCDQTEVPFDQRCNGRCLTVVLLLSVPSTPCPAICTLELYALCPQPFCLLVSLCPLSRTSLQAGQPLSLQPSPLTIRLPFFALPILCRGRLQPLQSARWP